MTRSATLLIFLTLAFPLAGCRSAAAPAPPLAPGYSSSVDQTLGQTLAAADAFYNKLAADAHAGIFHPTIAEASALNRLQAALATANPAYLAYHAGSGSLEAAQTAVRAVTAAENNVQDLVGGR